MTTVSRDITACQWELGESRVLHLSDRNVMVFHTLFPANEMDTQLPQEGFRGKTK
jgi:hypothetical protein